MKASELRIGNYINFKDRDDIFFCEVTSIDRGGYVHILRNFKDNLNNDDQPESIQDITPIMLTEEWLLRIGFEPHFGTYIFKTNRGIILIEEDLAEISFNETQRGFNAPCNYVHQLQNLYFTLTGQELEIKEL